jgi:anti-sigma B factor antagonist
MTFMARLANVAERSLGDAQLVEVTGELDISNADEFVELMYAAAERPGARLVLDLDRAAFIDSTVLNVLFVSASKLRAGDGRLAIVCTTHHIHRVLEAAGIEAAFPIVASREEALARLA